jgi:hypothetical protein
VTEGLGFDPQLLDPILADKKNLDTVVGTHTPFKKTHLDTNLELCDILLLLLGLHYRIRNTQVINQKSESLLSLFLPWKLKKQ